tara:strand:+ start:81 stop:257 length:177 start_codon:yes stop_codon:yes gene_type:complete
LDEFEYESENDVRVQYSGKQYFSFDRDKDGFTTNNTNQRIGKNTWLDKTKLMKSLKQK